jgi:hypothetical protein
MQIIAAASSNNNNNNKKQSLHDTPGMGGGGEFGMVNGTGDLVSVTCDWRDQ